MVRDIAKFLSGAFFVTAGASWYLAWCRIGVPIFGHTMTPDILWYRGFLHASLFAVVFWAGFLRK